jgi:hypothetical protein
VAWEFYCSQTLTAHRADRDPPLCSAKMAHYAFGFNAPYELTERDDAVRGLDLSTALR